MWPLSLLLCTTAPCPLDADPSHVHEGDASHEVESTSLVGTRTSHVCALRTQDLYAQMPAVPTFVMLYQVGNITFGALNTERPFILHCHSFYSLTCRLSKHLNLFHLTSATDSQNGWQ